MVPQQRCHAQLAPLTPEPPAHLLQSPTQYLGFVEVVRREAPREHSFLQAGNPQGSDTLSTLIEGMRFVLCASQTGLEVR